MAGMKKVQRANCDRASCGHAGGAGALLVLINGRAAMRVGVDTAGALVQGPGARQVLVEGFALALDGDAVAPHGKGAHRTSRLTGGSPDVLAAAAAQGTDAAGAERLSFTSLEYDLVAATRGFSMSDARRLAMAFFQGLRSLGADMLKQARENPVQTAGLMALCVVAPQACLVLGAPGMLERAWKLGEALDAYFAATTDGETDQALDRIGRELSGVSVDLGGLALSLRAAKTSIDWGALKGRIYGWLSAARPHWNQMVQALQNANPAAFLSFMQRTLSRPRPRQYIVGGGMPENAKSARFLQDVVDAAGPENVLLNDIAPLPENMRSSLPAGIQTMFGQSLDAIGQVDNTTILIVAPDAQFLQALPQIAQKTLGPGSEMIVRCDIVPDGTVAQLRQLGLVVEYAGRALPNEAPIMVNGQPVVPGSAYIAYYSRQFRVTRPR